MILRNETRNCLVVSDLVLAESFSDNLLGLLKKSNPRSLLFKTRFGIHTFFLSEPIDILVLDPNLEVVKIKEGLVPNRLFFWPIKHRLVIELPHGTISKSKTKPGDLLIVQSL